MRGGGFFKMCREILNTCVRKAERTSKGGSAAEGGQERQRVVWVRGRKGCGG